MTVDQRFTRLRLSVEGKAWVSVLLRYRLVEGWGYACGTARGCLDGGLFLARAVAALDDGAHGIVRVKVDPSGVATLEDCVTASELPPADPAALCGLLCFGRVRHEMRDLTGVLVWDCMYREEG